MRSVIVTVLAPFLTRWGTDRPTTRSLVAVTPSRSVTVWLMPLARATSRSVTLPAGRRALSVAPVPSRLRPANQVNDPPLSVLPRSLIAMATRRVRCPARIVSPATGAMIRACGALPGVLNLGEVLVADKKPSLRITRTRNLLLPPRAAAGSLMWPRFGPV